MTKLRRFIRELLGIYTCLECNKVFVSDGGVITVWGDTKLGYNCEPCFEEMQKARVDDSLRQTRDRIL